MLEQVLQVVNDFGLLISVLVGFLCFLVTLFRTGSVQKAIKNLKEYEEMIKYKVAEKPQEVKEQEFSKTITDYILDPVTNELNESPIPKDVDAEIQSHKDVALEVALERFLPDDVQTSDKIADYADMSADLSVLADAIDLAEDYREQYNLPDDMTTKQIFAFVQKQSDDLKQSILSQTNKQKEVADNGKSEKKETE